MSVLASLLCSLLISVHALADTKKIDAETTNEKALSALTTSLTLGSDKYADFGISLLLGVSIDWGFEFYSYTTRLNGAVVGREIGLAPQLRIDENNQLRFDFSVGGQDSGLVSRSFGIGYTGNIGAHFGNLERQTILTVNLSSTTYTMDGIQVSPREQRSQLGLTQDFSDNWAFGFSFAKATYTDQSIQNYRHYTSQLGIADAATGFEAGPLESSSSILGEFKTDSYLFRLELGAYQPVSGGTKSTTASFGWTHYWSEELNTSIKLSGTDTAGSNKGSIGLNLSYYF